MMGLIRMRILLSACLILLINIAGAVVPPLMKGLSWEAEDGLIEGKFIVENGAIRQDGWALSDTVESSLRGKASYKFIIPEEGKYLLKLLVKGESLSNNSFLVNIDNNPSSPEMIWDFPVTTGFEERTVSHRGNGNDNENEFTPMVFALSAGEHTLIIFGREADSMIDRISFEKMPDISTRPIVFTPNGDGENDLLFIHQSGDVKIFDRSGIFIAEIAAPAYWDGRDKNGNIVSSGAYILQLEGEKPQVINLVK